MVRRTLLVILLAVFAVPVAGATGSWSLLRGRVMRSQDPVALVEVRLTPPPSAVAVRLIGPPGKTLKGVWTSYCTKGKARHLAKGTYGGRGTVLARLQVGLTNPDECYLGTVGRLAQRPRSGSPTVTVRAEILGRY